ncbi:hypothetical protein HDV57DRAFT_480287 [Trichoderma longibrachiatum]
MSQIARPGPLDISKATQAIRSALKQCTSIEALMHGEWAENLLLDFNLWAAGVGASSASTSNLDQRLANQPAARAVVLGLLSALGAFIEDCVEIGNGANASTREDEHEVNADLDPTPLFGESDPFTVWSDDSDSTSRDESRPKSPVSPLRRVMTDIESSIDQLIRLGTLIRSSGTMARLRRADLNFTLQDYEHLDDETYEQSPKVDIADLRALKTHLVAILFMCPSQAVKDGLRNSEEQPDFAKCFNLLEDNHRQTIDRLIFANLRRRNRFLYAKRHAEKLALQLEEDDEAEESTVASEDETETEALKPTHESKPRQGAISATAPSEGTVDGYALKKLSQARSQETMSLKSVSLRRSGWPRPPRVDENRASFQCPCCCQTLATRESSQLLWRSHLSDDLQPFTCIYPDCAAAAPFFISRTAWKAHMRLEHKSFKYWECLACTDADASKTFRAKEDFMEHMNVQHGEAVSQTDVSKLSTICERIALATIRVCPLCTMQQNQGNEMDPEALLDHIADHIHDFSMLSLPWMDTPPDISKRADRVTFRRVQNWLNEGSMGMGEDPSGTDDVRENDLLLNYFGESLGGSSHGYREVSSPGSALSFESQPTAELDKEESAIHSNLMAYIKQHGLELFYEEDQELPQLIARKAARLKIEDHEAARSLDVSNLAKLALYQLIFYCGDSSSMRYGTRWRDQLEIVYCMARIYDLVRPDAYGAELRFINNAWPPGCMTTHDIRQTLESVKPRGVTMVGTSLRRKILEARVYNPVSEGERLERPILVCCFLDGCASHEPEEMLNDEILSAQRSLRRMVTRGQPSILPYTKLAMTVGPRPSSNNSVETRNSMGYCVVCLG